MMNVYELGFFSSSFFFSKEQRRAISGALLFPLVSIALLAGNQGFSANFFLPTWSASLLDSSLLKFNLETSFFFAPPPPQLVVQLPPNFVPTLSKLFAPSLLLSLSPPPPQFPTVKPTPSPPHTHNHDTIVSKKIAPPRKQKVGKCL